MTSPQPAFAPGAAANGAAGPSSSSAAGTAPSSSASTTASGNGLVSTEEELLRLAPQPHERVIYWGSGSPQAWRILIALEEKRLPYRGVCVSFSSGVLKSPFFRALNPRMRIPVLVEPADGLSAPANDSNSGGGSADDTGVASGFSRMSPFRSVIYESSAILEFLERKYPSPACMPRALPLFALAQSRLHESNEILSVVGDLVVYLRRFPPEKRSPALVDAKWATVENELRLWEAYLDGHQFLVDAETPYLCDYVLFTNIAYAVRCGLQLDGLYPRLATFYMRLCARPSIDKTWPPHWRTSFGTKVLTKCFRCAGKGQLELGRMCECQQQPVPMQQYPTVQHVQPQQTFTQQQSYAQQQQPYVQKQ